MKSLYKSLAAVVQQLVLLPRLAAIASTLLLLLNSSGVWGQTTRTAAQTGSWSAASTWVGNTVPGPNDNVAIPGRITVTVDISTATCMGITIYNGDGGNSPATLEFSVGGVLTVTGSVVMSTRNDRSGNIVMTNGGVLNVGGSITRIGGSTFTPGTGTVNFNGSGAQTIPAFNYHNLTSSGTGGRTLASSGTIGIAGTFTPGTNTYTITGSTINFNGSGTQTIPAFNYHNLTSSGTGARTLASLETIGIAGTFTPGTNTYTITGSTINFNGADQTIAALTYNNLSLSGSGTKTFGAATTINGNLSVANGVTVNLGTTANHTTGTLTLTGRGTANGTWGASNSTAATFKNNQFANSTQVITVTTDTRATPVVTITAAGPFTYNRSPQGPDAATNTGTGTSYTFSYVGVAPTNYSASTTRPTNAGTYRVTATVAASTDGFWATANATQDFSITRLSLTASLVGTVTKVYDGTNTASLSANNFSLTGLLGSDVVAITNTIGTFDNINVGNNKSVSVATPTLGGAAAGNYVLNGPLSGTIGTITPRPLTITANDAFKCAGTALELGTSAFTSNGLVSGDAISSVTLSSTGAAASAAGGTYPIVAAAAAGTGLANYTITYNSGTLTVRSISATVPTIPAITYGIAQATAGSFTLTGAGVTAGSVTVGGTANSPFEFALSPDSSFSTSQTLAPSNGSINQELWVRLRPTSLNAGNYTESISLSAGGTCSSTVQLNGTVNPRPINVFAAASGATKTFNGTADAPLSLVVLSGTALQNDAVIYSATAANFNDANAGTLKTITVTGISIGGAAAANYTLQNTSATTTGTIVPLAVTITPSPNQSKKWNSSDPAFTFTNSPAFIGSDRTTGALARQAGENVGSYPFTLGTLSAGSNYTLSLAAGSFEILRLTEDDAELVSSGASSDMSDPAAWQWFDGVTFQPATEAPNQNSANVTIKNGHIMRQKNDFKVSNGKKFKLEPNTRYIVEAGKKFEIDGEADFNDQEVILESNASGTAWIPEIKGQLKKATKVTVERFVPASVANGRWRFIALPLDGVTSIRAALAANRPPINSTAAAANEPAGSGILLRGHNMRQPDGKFDFWAEAVGRFSNIRFYTSNATGGTWASATNTPDVSLPPDRQGYMVAFRGDRQSTNFNDAANRATTFRPTGTLKQGNQTVPVNQKYVVVGNPYAAPLDLDRMYNNTGNSSLIERNFWIWDATLGAEGGYRNILWTGNSYVMNFPPASGKTVQDYLTIQSGQAFFVVQNGTATGNLLIRENNKGSQQPNVGVFRVSNESEVATRTQSQDMGNMYVTLHQSTGTALQQTLDGALVLFGKQFSNEVNESVDVTKVNNFTENISVLRSNKYMTVEGRPFPVAGDTVAIPLWSMGRRTYALEFNTAALSGRNLTAQLVDRYTGTVQPIQLDGAKTLYHFTVNADAASSSLNRFRVVFGAPSALPVEFIEVKAQARNNNVQVEWKTGYESEIDRFEVERSADGRAFSKVGTVVPQNAMNGAAYNFLDAQPLSAQNFYRIRSVDRDGSFKLSSVVRVNREQRATGVQVYPTVVTNRTVNIALTNMQAGEYDVVLFNNNGQALVRSRLVYAGGSSAQSITLGNSNLPAGIYQLVVRNNSDYQERFSLLIQ